MILGVPKEIMDGEGRVAATPDTVSEFRKNGLTVLVEQAAGVGSNYTDEAYHAAGAKIVDPREVWEQADIVIKVKQPLFDPDLNIEETFLLPKGHGLVTFLHPAANPQLVRSFRDRHLFTVSMDCIPRNDETRSMDALSSMSLLAGYRAAILSAEHLPKMLGSADAASGHVEGANALVVGYGVVGAQVTRTLQALGATVRVIDLSSDAIQRAEAAGAIPVPVVQKSSDTLQNVRKTVQSQLPTCDVAILGVLAFGQKAPILITKEMIASMPARSLIVDVSVDQGGNCEAVEPGEIIEFQGVKVLGIANLPGQLPIHATQLYSRAMASFIHRLMSGGKINYDDPVVKAATITRDGRIYHQPTLDAVSVMERAASS